MADASASPGPPESDPIDLLREVTLTGLAVVVPALVSLYVLVVVWSFLAQLLTPIANTVAGGAGLLGQLLAGVLLVFTVLAVGFVAHFRTGKRALDYLDAAIERIPGLGTVYRSFRRMSDVMIESDADHFRDVKLVAFPTEDAYAIAFETADAGERIETAVGEEEVVTVFLPMAPNPFMGGFVLYVPEDRVIDVDLTVEEGIRATVTSGVVVGSEEAGDLSGETWELSDFEGMRPDAERLQALGIDVDELRSLDVEEIRSLDREDIEERLLAARERFRERGRTVEDDSERGGDPS